MTTPTAESMKKAKSILLELLTKQEGTLTKWPDGILDTQEAFALALDNAREAGLREAAKIARDYSKMFKGNDLASHVTVDALTATAHIIDRVAEELEAAHSLAPAKTKGTE